MMVQAARTATATEPPPVSTLMAASCEAPAKTMVENPRAAPAPSPAATGVAPATNPNGMTPITMGATAAAPARASESDMALHDGRPRARAGNRKTRLTPSGGPHHSGRQ